MTQDILTAAKERYSDAVDAFREQRTRMLDDFKFSNPSDPQQWDPRARQVRESNPDGARPCLTLDHSNQYIQQVVNDARQNKPGITFLPSSGGARQEVASALDGVMRHIEYQSRAQIAYDTAIDHSARGGLGWIRIVPEVVEHSLNYQEIRIKRIADPLSVIADPDWQEPDGADMRYCFVETSVTPREYERRYGKKAAATSWAGDRTGGWFADNSIRICEYFDLVETKANSLIIRMPDGTKRAVTEDQYWQVAQEIGTQPMIESQQSATQAKVMWRTMSGVEILEETEFPARMIPMVPVIGHELWIEGKRYLCGMVRRMREAQQAYNYERSAWVEAVALQPKAPFLAAAEAVEGHENEWSRANKSNLAYLPWNAFGADGNALPMPKRAEPPTIPAAFAQGASFADMDIQASIGMYRDSIGAPSSQHSGRAIMAKQREGDTANFHILDNQSRSIERVGRIVLDMIPRIYDEPREARILGNDGTSKAVKIDVNGSAYAIDGEMTSINPSSGTYDVRVKAGPSYTTLRQEASDGLTQMMQGNPGVAQIVAPIWARMQDWPEADKLSKALLAMAPPPVQQALGEEQTNPDDPAALKQQLQQLEQQAQQMHQMLEQASQKMQELQAGEKAKHIDHIAKASELEIRQYEAETNRLKALQTGMTPEQVQAMVMQLMSQSARTDMDGSEDIEQALANGPDVEGVEPQPEQPEQQPQTPEAPEMGEELPQ